MLAIVVPFGPQVLVIKTHAISAFKSSRGRTAVPSPSYSSIWRGSTKVTFSSGAPRTHVCGTSAEKGQRTGTVYERRRINRKAAIKASRKCLLLHRFTSREAFQRLGQKQLRRGVPSTICNTILDDIERSLKTSATSPSNAQQCPPTFKNKTQSSATSN